jgi:hypothetical protein
MATDGLVAAADANQLYTLSSLAPPHADHALVEEAESYSLESSALEMWISKALSKHYQDARQGLRGLVRMQKRKGAPTARTQTDSAAPLCTIIAKGLASYDQEQVRLSLMLLSSLLEQSKINDQQFASLLPQLESAIDKLPLKESSLDAFRHIKQIIQQATILSVTQLTHSTTADAPSPSITVNVTVTEQNIQQLKIKADHWNRRFDETD